MKPRKFKLHFNRVNMQRKKDTVWSVHTAGQCIQVEKVVVEVPVETIFKPEATQPRAYLTGRGVVRVAFDTAYITED